MVKWPYLMAKTERSSKKSAPLIGTVKRHPDGFGFFVSDNSEDPDVYIPRQNMAGLMSNDRVKVEVYPDKKFRGGDRWRGDVVEVISRAQDQVVGVYQDMNESEGVLLDDSFAWGENLYIEQKNRNGAEPGQLVAVQITQYPEAGLRLEGKVTYIIGEAEDPLNDVKRVIYASGIPTDFDKKVIQECKSFPEEVEESDFKGRTDLREKAFVTIDGKTAKDFDDAVFVEMEKSGFRLYVSIADVSHYVKPNTALDDEAYERGTSVYLPGTVVPMLPEALSNELCSLKPKVNRLALTCEMLIDFSGEISSYKFYESVIRSHARVTYGEAQQMIEGEELESFAHVRDSILHLADLARLLMGRRFKAGALDLEIPETEVMVNAQGEVTDLVRADRLFAHRLIEELMLVANICAARFFGQREVPGMFRIHEPPDQDAIQLLERYLHNFGGTRKLGGGKLQKKLSRALQDFADKPEAQILNILTLRSMSQAKYSPDNVGHFGLGFDDYSHFTSPIRRYPDLIVHRQIKSQVRASDYRVVGEDYLTSAGVFLSACEQRAVKAERHVIAIKKARFMQKHVGKEFEGVVSSVAKFGLFVLLREYDVDGRVAIEDLGNDKWIFDEESLNLVGKRSGRVYQIGDRLNVTVANVDTNEGKIDFVLGSVSGSPKDEESELGADLHRKTDRNDDKKRGKAAKNRRGLRSSRLSKRRGKAKTR